MLICANTCRCHLTYSPSPTSEASPTVNSSLSVHPAATRGESSSLIRARRSSQVNSLRLIFSTRPSLIASASSTTSDEPESSSAESLVLDGVACGNSLSRLTEAGSTLTHRSSSKTTKTCSFPEGTGRISRVPSTGGASADHWFARTSGPFRGDRDALAISSTVARCLSLPRLEGAWLTARHMELRIPSTARNSAQEFIDQLAARKHNDDRAPASTTKAAPAGAHKFTTVKVWVEAEELNSAVETKQTSNRIREKPVLRAENRMNRQN
jgi:hypothetical protein